MDTLYVLTDGVPSRGMRKSYMAIALIQYDSSPEAAALGLHSAFLASPTHLANMVNPTWTTVGVGVHTDGASWYITLVFR